MCFFMYIRLFRNNCIYYFNLGHGIPNNVAEEHTRTPVDEHSFPPGEAATALYAQDLGSTLTAQSLFGTDPFTTDEARQQCQDHFINDVPDLHVLLDCAVNLNYVPLQDAVMKLIQITKQYSTV